jgi:hypothetical protein
MFEVAIGIGTDSISFPSIFAVAVSLWPDSPESRSIGRADEAGKMQRSDINF